MKNIKLLAAAMSIQLAAKAMGNVFNQISDIEESELLSKAMKKAKLDMENAVKDAKLLSQEEIDKLGVEGIKRGIANGSLRRITKPYVKHQRKVGRNEPCPCGSNMKYKKCHGLG